MSPPTRQSRPRGAASLSIAGDVAILPPNVARCVLCDTTERPLDADGLCQRCAPVSGGDRICQRCGRPFHVRCVARPPRPKPLDLGVEVEDYRETFAANYRERRAAARGDR